MRYVTVGHVCVDEIPGAPDRLGGTVFFAAGQAATAGCEVVVVTAGTAATVAELGRVLDGPVRVRAVPAAADTRFGFGPDAGIGPTHLVSSAPALDVESLRAVGDPPPGPGDVVHLAPVFGELTGELIDAAAGTGAFVGATPQGLLRSTDAAGRLVLTADAWPVQVLAADALIMSDAEYALMAELGLLESYVGLVFRTRGPDGASVYRGGVELARCRPAATRDVDPTRTIGAGDVFAAAAFVALAGGADPGAALDAAVSSATAYVQRDSAAPAYSAARGATIAEAVAG